MRDVIAAGGLGLPLGDDVVDDVVDDVIDDVAAARGTNRGQIRYRDDDDDRGDESRRPSHDVIRGRDQTSKRA